MTNLPPKPGQVSLAVAIAGPRASYPEDLAPRVQQVTGAFRRSHERHPKTPLLLISPPAEGDMPIPYVAGLPMPQVLYPEDFPPNQSDTEFRTLLSPTPPQPPTTPHTP
jgi:hypothetical protein